MEHYFGRIAEYASLATIFVMISLNSVVFSWFDAMSVSAWILLGVLELLFSFGLYKLLYGTIFGILKRYMWLRKIVLGPYFLEGTWVGTADQYSGALRYTLEFFDQSEGRLSIQGFMYDADLKNYGSWDSQATQVDLENRKLFYAYGCDMLDSAEGHPGVASFKLTLDPKDGRPIELVGYAADLTNGEKDANHEFKISDKTLSIEEALQKAVEKFGGGKTPHSAA